MVRLRDGTAVPVRPIRPDDAAALQRFHSRLGEQTIYRRFFAAVPQLSDLLAAYFTHLDAQDREALVALDPDAPAEIIAVVRFDRTPGTDRAEYAAVVADAWQHRGLGLALTRALLEVARARGIAHFDAYVLPENHPMLALFGRLGLPLQSHWAADQGLRVAIDLDTP